MNQRLSATFSKPLDPATVTTATFRLSGTSDAPITGSVAYDAQSQTATFTPSSDLAPFTMFTATITTGVKDLAGTPLAADYSWFFTTGGTRDTTAPTVLVTAPLDAASNYPPNGKVTATFSEAMDPATLQQGTFTLAQGTTSVPGTVSYSDVGTTATFAPSTALTGNTTYTATVTTGARDLAANSLATTSVWTFTTSASPDTTPPIVTLTSPANNETNVAIDKRVNATFNEPLDPATLTTLTFKVTGPSAVTIAGTVAYDASSRLATFRPKANLASNAQFTATIKTGVKDLAGNALASDYIWTFATGTNVGQQGVNLRSAAPFAILAGSTVANTGQTKINGALGLSAGTAVTGFPPGQVNGATHVGDPIAAQAKLDLTTAYNDAQARSTNAISLPGNLGGLTLAPGLYANSSTVQISGTGANAILTLDAQGDSSAVFFFKMASTLPTDSGTSIVLAGGAKAANIYWSVGSSATLGTTSIFYGNILADQSITLQTGATLTGRALTRIAAVTLD
ncbi:MAG: Ig-like domain-containing protein, partial [Planctomycetota bacterium]